MLGCRTVAGGETSPWLALADEASMMAKTTNRHATASEKQSKIKLLFLVADMMHLLHTLIIIIHLMRIDKVFKKND